MIAKKNKIKNDSTVMPVLFVGHGSPMNAIEDTEFSRGWRGISGELPKPESILCVSAHWETNGTRVTSTAYPETIHDFGGFPRELYEVVYPAPGSQELAKYTENTVRKTKIEPDDKWGLDHGAWSVLRHMYPDADIPVIQLSLDYTKDPAYHYDLAKELSSLRRRGVLIAGSGNIVHNLRMIDWKNKEAGYDWAKEANLKLKNLMLDGDHKSLIEYEKLGREVGLSVPTPEHYLPLLYVLALKEEKESISFFNDKTVMGSISMTSLLIK